MISLERIILPDNSTIYKNASNLKRLSSNLKVTFYYTEWLTSTHE